MVGKWQWQKCETAGHTESPDRNQREMNAGAMLALSFLCSLRCQPMEVPPTLRTGFPTSVEVLWKHLQEHTQEFFWSVMLTNPVVKTTHHRELEHFNPIHTIYSNYYKNHQKWNFSKCDCVKSLWQNTQVQHHEGAKWFDSSSERF